MKDLIKLIRHILPAVSLLLLMPGCKGNRYKAVSDNFNGLLEGETAIDTLFVRTMAANTAEAFDSNSAEFLQAYARDFDDAAVLSFSPNTTYSQRQDSILFYMQDFLLNTFRYEESIELGILLDSRLDGSPLHSACLGDIGVAYFYLGNLEEAIKYQRKGYEMDLPLDDPELISSDLNQLAAMCLRSGKYELARDYILDAIRVEEPLGRSAPLAIRYGLASEVYLKLNEFSTAEEYVRKALELDRRDGRESKVGIRLSQLAAIQLAQNDDAGAGESLAEALPLLESHNNINSLAIANCQLGDLELRKGENAGAQQCFQQALQLCRRAGIKPIEKRALRGLWLSMKDTDPARGAEYLEHYTALSDSLGSADSDAQLANLRAEFATRELRLDNERLEAQNRMHRIILFSSAVFILLLCVVGWLIYRNRASRQRIMRRIERARINFFTNITHEFRTPLTVILGLSSELEKKEASHAEAKVISEEGQNLLGLVNQLLDIGKVSSAAGQADWRHGNIVGYVNMAVESLRPLAVSRDIKLVFSPAENDVDMDFVPDYIRKIVVNLLSNALKYTGKDGRVLVSSLVEDSRLVLRFVDNGPGIKAEDLEHIFEPFYQGSNSTASVGSGVGLSLVKLLVKAMDGDISVKSSSAGTVFTVTLPLKHTGDALPLDVSTSELAAVNAIDGVRERPVVLIVEDNVNVANYIASQLSDSYRIYVACNGEEGFDKALSIIPDLIITDVMMPVMDGIEFLKKLRQNDILNHLPVVMVTAKVSDSDRIEGISAGADAYISKPFNADELRAVAARLIDQRHLLCEKYRNVEAVIPDDGTVAEDRDFIERLTNVIHSFISGNRRTDISEIADRMNVSVRALTRRVQALTGESTVAFVNRVKINKAKHLLDTDPTSPLSDIAMRSGFDDPAYFSRIFKQIESISPTAYRRQKKNEG